MFESSVNSEYSKTNNHETDRPPGFESSVNSEYSKTEMQRQVLKAMFESSVNSEYSKTFKQVVITVSGFESSVNSAVKFNNRNINFPAKRFLFAIFIIWLYKELFVM